jgi:Rad3-related DNA helicase
MIQIPDEKLNKLFPFPPRGKQLEIVRKIISAYLNGKQHVVLSLPTGGGKSVIAYAVSKYFQEAYILTNQKVLQEQYKRDLNVPYILGRSNYICAQNNQLTCELGMCKRQSANYCDKCPYLADKISTRNNWITNMNYAYFLNITKAKNLPHRSLLVMDESHVLENEMIKAGTIKFADNTFKALGIGDLKLPKVKDSDYDKRNWLFETVLPRVREEYLYLKNQIKQFEKFNFTKETKKIISRYMATDRIVSIISEIQKELADHQKVIIQSNKEYIEFKVLYGYNLFDKYFAKQADYFLHMSATILNKEQYCRKLNLDYDDVEYLEYDSEFPIENRLVHFTPVGSLSWKNKANTIPELVKRVREILQQYPDSKGIIHTVNYELAEVIIDQLYGTAEGSRLLMPRGTNKQSILNTFYKSNNPYVLISPSLAEGLDLKDDLSRFCIICKMPYANIADKWVKTRLTLDPNWYANHTAETLVQMCGRSVRSKDDFATTYILDEDFLRFAETYYYLLPNWWKDSVVCE